MSITLHPFWVISIPHTSPLSFSGSLTQKTFGSNGHFSSGYHLKVPVERQWEQEWLSRDSLQPGSHREDSDWAGVSLTEQGWSTVWAARCKCTPRDSDRQQRVGTRACLEVRVKDLYSPLNNIIFRKGWRNCRSLVSKSNIKTQCKNVDNRACWNWCVERDGWREGGPGTLFKVSRFHLIPFEKSVSV